jgi:RNA polymerase sigma factor (TIGR02999 family)
MNWFDSRENDSPNVVADARNLGQIGLRSQQNDQHLKESAPMSEVTRILSAIDEGDPHAAAELLPLVYDELRRLAAQKMAQEAPGQTLQATALVHEAYLRLVGGLDTSTQAGQRWNSRGHFFAAAAEAMRRILIEAARRKQTEKHGGGYQRIDLVDVELSAPDAPQRWLLLDDALSCLAQEDPVVAQVAQLRLFAGLSADEAAPLLGISRATAFRHWTYARAWLQAKLQESEGAE